MDLTPAVLEYYSFRVRIRVLTPETHNTKQNKGVQNEDNKQIPSNQSL